MEIHDEVNVISEEISKVSDTYERRQNLPGIKYISATHTSDVSAVLSVLRACEEITLDTAERKMALDIAQSINEHGELTRSVAIYYLIRYGMLLEREKSMTGKECFPHSANDG